MNLYNECESFYNDFSIWIGTKCVNALMMIFSSISVQIRTKCVLPLMNPYEVCEDFFIWIRTKYANAFMMILFIRIRTNPYKVCAIMQQRGDQSRSRPSSPSTSSSLFSKTFLLFRQIQMHKEIFGGNYKELLTVGQFFCGLFAWAVAKYLARGPKWQLELVGQRRTNLKRLLWHKQAKSHWNLYI